LTLRTGVWPLVAVLLFVMAAAGGAWLAVATDDPEATAETVDCWDGSDAPSAHECPAPTGMAGLASVFPSLRSDCAERGSVEGKAEVVVCTSRGLVIRYSRWDPFIDRIAYFHEANPRAFVATWRPGGVDAGVQWTSREAVVGEPQPWQWSATYASHPYSVSVEGRTKADRSRGLRLVRALAPQAIGLAPEPVTAG